MIKEETEMIEKLRDMELWLYVVTFVVVGLLLFGTFGLNIIRAAFTQRYEIIEVAKSERIAEHKSGRYLVFTKQGVYQNTDSLFMGKFNSSDLYSKIEAKKTYKCLVTGWRNGFFSWYPNLIKCEEVK